MSGHVFHPGHEELHGVTVVVESPGGTTWVGRYHEQTARGLLLHDVATYDPGIAGPDREAWIGRQIKFGITIDARHLVVPTNEVSSIQRLHDWKPTVG